MRFERFTPVRTLPTLAALTEACEGDVRGAQSTLSYLQRCEHYRDENYHVAVDRESEHGFGEDTAVWHLSIKRHDRKPIRNWRKLQEIKNSIVGPEFEAVELYPAESRLVDTSNQYHLWVLVVGGDTPLKFPFGFPTRAVYDESNTPEAMRKVAPRAVQRPVKMRDLKPDTLGHNGLRKEPREVGRAEPKRVGPEYRCWYFGPFPPSYWWSKTGITSLIQDYSPSALLTKLARAER